VNHDGDNLLAPNLQSMVLFNVARNYLRDHELSDVVLDNRVHPERKPLQDAPALDSWLYFHNKYFLICRYDAISYKMKKSVKSKKDQFRRLELQRDKLIEYLLSDCLLMQGSYSELLVKCGKAGCNCEAKPAHLVTRLGTRRNNTPQNQVVRIADRQRVRSLVEIYKKHKATFSDFKALHLEQEEIVKAIIGDKDEPYE